MAKIDRREHRMRQISDKVANIYGALPTRTQSHHVGNRENDRLPYTNPKDRYHISSSENYPLLIGTFIRENRGDPALKARFAHPSLLRAIMISKIQNFYNSLKDHLLLRLSGKEYDDETEFTTVDRDTIIIRNNKLYRHKTCRFNFTTYDVRRSQDSVNPSTVHRDIMINARDDPSNRGYHPFWYARVIGIFHVQVRYNQPRSDWQRVEFLWVRWFGRSEGTNIRVSQPVNQDQLDWVGFVTEEDDTETFGYLNPSDVIRSCHLIPAFKEGKTEELMGPSIARADHEGDYDWKYYYVNRFATIYGLFYPDDFSPYL